MSRIYLTLVIFRLLMVFFPQTGYIHPDEFFQTVEVAAGDALNLHVHRSWEFNSTFPVRSIVFPHLMAGLPLRALSGLSSLLPQSLSLVTPYMVLVIPRLVAAVCSLMVDLGVLMLAKEVKCCTNMALLLHASSYVTLVYLTRTFSNSTEAVLFSALLVGMILVSKETSSETRFCMGTMAVASILVAGIFNRPTFCLFAAFPCLVFKLRIFWGTESADHRHLRSTPSRVVNFVFFGAAGVLLTTIVFVTLDTAYFKSTDLVTLLYHMLACVTHPLITTLRAVHKCVASYVFTPWNFIVYNTNVSNLAMHGLHPWFLHTLVNLPLLLGPLVVACYSGTARAVFSYLRSLLIGARTRSDSLRTFLLGWMFLLPLLFLSAFPHQEPRFLLPLVPLGTILAAKQIHGTRWLKYVVPSWIAFNVLATIFFGFLHQGGVVPALLDGQAELRASREGYSRVTVHMVFARTYMPPRHLLLLPHNQTSTHVYDLGGKSLHKIADFIRVLGTRADQSRSEKMLLYIPSVVASHFLIKLKHKDVVIFCPHLSIEDPPRFDAWFAGKIDFTDLLFDFCISVIEFG